MGNYLGNKISSLDNSKSGVALPGGSGSSGAVAPRRSEEDILQMAAAAHVRSFAFRELAAATRNFRPDSVVGEGGFGCVFKGWLDCLTLAPARPSSGGSMVVAVKKLNNEGLQGHREWLAEVNYLGQLSHPNLVKLVGYCVEDERRLIVYEFMPRGSLEHHLFRRNTYLSWAHRMKIALGAAKGLAFLHSQRAKVIYRDFKTSNILLDSDYTAKLSDFGLAKDVPEGDMTHVSTRLMGTQGYADPEYLATGHLTTKSDVYSFGVVLLEMLTGRRAIDKNRPTKEHKLIDWAWPYLTSRRKLRRILDPQLAREPQECLVTGATVMAALARLCLSEEAKHRPNMDQVVLALEKLQDDMEMSRSPKEEGNRNGGTCDGGGGFNISCWRSCIWSC